MPAASSGARNRTAYWQRLARLIPGYDPWATAGACTFHPQLACNICDFFEEVLTHVKGEWAGKPIILEDWQRAVLGMLFGWLRKDGTRRYRKMLFYVPRKNAKTTIGAGIGLYLLMCDDENGADIYSAAADEKQAALCFDTAKGMLLGNAELSQRGRPYRRSILYEETAGGYHVLSSKASTKHGLNPHGILVDELHAQKDNELVDTLTTAVGARRQPLTLYMTTADFGRPSICNETYHYACQVRDRVVDDPEFLPVIYEATRDDDWTKEATWRKANPNLGVSVKLDFMIQQCKEAQEKPSYENTFKRLHLNIITEQANRWLQLHRWDKCAGPLTPQQLEESLVGQECFGGLDLASTTDLAAFAMVFPPAGERTTWAVVLRVWAPKENAIMRERKDRVPYLTWSKQGFLKLTDGDVIDYDVIRRDVVELGTRFNITEIAIDRWASAQITNQLGGDGYEMVPFGMGFGSLSAPTKELETLVLGEGLTHGGHPLLRWCASNVATVTDDIGNMKPSKKHSTEKIDPVVATIMALGRAMARDQGNGKSVYDERGIEEL